MNEQSGRGAGDPDQPAAEILQIREAVAALCAGFPGE